MNNKLSILSNGHTVKDTPQECAGNIILGQISIVGSAIRERFNEIFNRLRRARAKGTELGENRTSPDGDITRNAKRHHSSPTGLLLQQIRNRGCIGLSLKSLVSLGPIWPDNRTIQSERYAISRQAPLSHRTRRSFIKRMPYFMHRPRASHRVRGIRQHRVATGPYISTRARAGVH